MWGKSQKQLPLTLVAELLYMVNGAFIHVSGEREQAHNVKRARGERYGPGCREIEKNGSSGGDAV